MKLIYLLSFTFSFQLMISQVNLNLLKSLKIYNGDTTEIEKVPWQGAMFINDKHECGAIVLNKKWVLTAAHCLVATDNSKYFLYFGDSDIESTNEGQKVSVDEKFIHPKWISSQEEYGDFALIKLKESLIFNSKVQPIEYADACNIEHQSFLNSKLLISGWGLIGHNPPVKTNRLRSLELPVIKMSQADAINEIKGCTLNYATTIDADYFALYDKNFSANIGTRDSGGPAVLNKNGNKINAGVASLACNPPNAPSIFAEVKQVSNWIEEVTGIPQSQAGIDLFTKDRPWDLGDEPSSDILLNWLSEDIWVRNQDDDIEEHQNPIYYKDPEKYNYVYVRVRNRGCQASTGQEFLTLNWAKAATSFRWPDHWDGSVTVNNIPFGGLIDKLPIPSISPGSAAIVKFKWRPPNPYDFSRIGNNPIFLNNEPHHFCLLSRVVSPNDVMHTETEFLFDNVSNNNNISMKNISVIQNPPDDVLIGTDLRASGANVIIRNPLKHDAAFDIEIKEVKTENSPSVLNLHNALLTLENNLWQAWIRAGANMNNAIIYNPLENLLKLTGSTALFKNLTLEPNKDYILNLALSEILDLEKKDEIIFDVIQKESVSKKIIGGERFVFKRSEQQTYSLSLIKNATNGLVETPSTLLKLYPNPANTQFFIKLNFNYLNQELFVEIKDMQGNLKKKIKIDKELISLKTTNLESGRYSVLLINNGHIVEQQILEVK